MSQNTPHTRPQFATANALLRGYLRFFSLTIICLALGIVDGWAQMGAPPVKNYFAKDYQADQQNFDVSQDRKGVMYFGNKLGVLEYDGVYWRLITLPDSAAAHRVTTDSSGRILVGAEREFGYLKPDSVGRLQYFSLSASLKIKSKEAAGHTGLTRDIYVFNNLAYFATDAGLFVWDGKKTTLCRLDDSQVVQTNKRLIWQPGWGLVTVDGENAFRAPSSKWLDQRPVVAILPYDEKRVLIANEVGLFLHDGKTLVFKGSRSDYLLRRSVISDVKLLKNKLLAIATQRGGLILLNQRGRVETTLTEAAGLQNEEINHVYIDREGGMWLCLNAGLSRVEIYSPITSFDDMGLRGGINDLVYHQRANYVATERGLYYLDTREAEARFEPIDGIVSNTNSIVEMPAYLYAGSSSGIFRVDADTSFQLSNVPTNKLLRSRVYGNRIYAAPYRGLAYIEIKPFRDSEEIKNLPGFYDRAYNIVEDWFGYLWAETDRGIIQIDPRHGVDKPVKLKFPQGLPGGGRVKITEAFGKILFCTKKGVYNYHYGKKRFFPDSSLGDAWLGKAVSNLYQDAKGNVLVTTEKGVHFGRFNPKTKTYTWEDGQFQRYPNLKATAFLSKNTGEFWVGTEYGLLRYDPAVRRNEKQPFRTLIRRVVISDDSLLFGGAFNTYNALPDTLIDSLLLSKGNLLNGFGRIRFEFSGTSFIDESATLYQYQLEGFDKGWTPWSSLAFVEYVNLPLGEYIFRVRAKNANGVVSDAVVYRFKIEPHWYETRQAKILFVLSGILTLILIFIVSIQWYSNNLKQRNEKLEQIVQERTREITEQKNEIERASLEIARVNLAVTQSNELLLSANESILEKNQEIAKKNEDITDSIRYAQRIQQSILPRNDAIDAVFNDYFIFYRPRDIVSGDFYWFSRINDNLVIFAGGDCTGHGVPGALMSMIGSSLLNKIVNENDIYKPSDILNDLHSGVHFALRQNEEGVYLRDGMDIAICAFYLKEQRLEIASAQRPVLVYQHGVLNQIIGDKHAIGGPVSVRQYTNHELNYEKGDAIYFFSDGVVDQFGGELGKKFQTRKFREMIEGITTRSMSDQKKIVETAFDEWKGEFDQLDDVLVAGFRL